MHNEDYSLKNSYKRKKFKIFVKDDLKCCYCGITAKRLQDLTLDPVVPRKLGGTNSYSNLLTSCRKCNSKKSDLLLTDFIDKYDIKITPRINEFL